MKASKKVIIVSAFFMFTIESFAYGSEDGMVQLVERPQYLSHDKPDTVGCRRIVNVPTVKDGEFHWMYHCSSPEAPIVGSQELVRGVDTGRVWVQSLEPQEILCNNGLCRMVNNFHGEYIGVHQGEQNYNIGAPNGYYIVATESKVLAHRLGTGPYADRFPEPFIESEQYVSKENSNSANSPIKNVGGELFQLHCSPRLDRCNYTDSSGREYELDREDLPKYIPILESQYASDCIQEACYNSDMDIIGLNPDYHLWR